MKSIKKIGRNDKCPCNSEKKYKKCCLIKQVSQVQICQMCEKGKIINNFCKLCSDIEASGIIINDEIIETQSEMTKYDRNVTRSLRRIYNAKDIHEIKTIIAPRICRKKMLSQTQPLNYPVNRNIDQHLTTMIEQTEKSYIKCHDCKKIIKSEKAKYMVNVNSGNLLSYCEKCYEVVNNSDDVLDIMKQDISELNFPEEKNSRDEYEYSSYEEFLNMKNMNGKKRCEQELC